MTRRVTMADAAQVLGISKDAVRKRVQRGTLRSDMGEDGRRYVYLPLGPDAGADADRTNDNNINNSFDPRDELISTLREQLEAERAANRENRRLLAAALERIPAIEASEASGQPHTNSEAAGSTMTPDTPVEPETATQRPWWRRLIGG